MDNSNDSIRQIFCGAHRLSERQLEYYRKNLSEIRELLTNEDHKDAALELWGLIVLAQDYLAKRDTNKPLSVAQNKVRGTTKKQLRVAHIRS